MKKLFWFQIGLAYKWCNTNNHHCCKSFHQNHDFLLDCVASLGFHNVNKGGYIITYCTNNNSGIMYCNNKSNFVDIHSAEYKLNKDIVRCSGYDKIDPTAGRTRSSVGGHINYVTSFLSIRVQRNTCFHWKYTSTHLLLKSFLSFPSAFLFLFLPFPRSSFSTSITNGVRDIGKMTICARTKKETQENVACHLSFALGT